MRRKYQRPITDIFTEVTAGIPKTLQAKTVTDNGGVSQTLYVCDILYTQKDFNVTIDGKSYKIIAFDEAAGTITVTPNFTGDPTIAVNTIFDLYPVYFFTGTPSSTQDDLQDIPNASNKTPMIWAWKRWKEKTFTDQDPEREAFMELFALTQPPKKLAQMKHDRKEAECVLPMRRLMEMLIEQMHIRTDLFYMDEFIYEMEDQEDFGIVARTKGVERAIFTDQLSGTGIASLVQFAFKDSCPCPVPEDRSQFDDSFDDSFS